MSKNWPPNPFWSGRGAWGSNGLFLDRDELLRRLTSYAEDPRISSAVLFGPRRMGKTAVLHRLREQWQAAGAGAPAVALLDLENFGSFDRAGLQDPARFWFAIDDALVALGLLPPANTTVEDPQTLRERWWRRCEKGNVTPVRLLFDEVELLYGHKPELLLELLRCFRVPGDRQPAFVLLSWGRPLGLPQRPEVNAALKDSPHEHLEPIEEHAFRRDMSRTFEAVGVPLSQPAEDALWQISRGHPLYAMAVARRIYDRRKEHKDRSPILVEDITAGLVKDSAVRHSTSLLHAWDQVSRSQLALAWGLARMAVRDQHPDAPFDSHAASRSFAIQSVAETLPQLGVHAAEISRSAADGLEYNFVLERDGEARPPLWRIRSPFFAAWLATHEFVALDSDSRNVDPSSGKSAADLLAEAHEASTRGDALLARAKLDEARRLAPGNPSILIEQSRVLCNDGQLDDAAATLRAAELRGDRNTIREELAIVVEKQIQRALEEGDDPISLWDEYRHLTIDRGLGWRAARGVIDAFAKRWRRQLEGQHAHDALTTLRLLERQERRSPLLGWRAHFLAEYTELLRSYPQSTEQLRVCLSAIGAGLLPLTETSDGFTIRPGLDEPLSVLPKSLLKLVQRLAPRAVTFGDLPEDLRDDVAPEAERRDDEGIDEAWRQTIEVLTAATTRRISLTPSLETTALSLLLIRAPKHIESDLRRVFRDAVGLFVVADIADGNRRAEQLLAFSTEIDAELSIELIREQIEERILRIETAPLEDIETTFAMLPGLLQALVGDEQYPRDRLSPVVALDLAELTLASVRNHEGGDEWRIIARQATATHRWIALFEHLRDAARRARDDKNATRAQALVATLSIPDAYKPLAAGTIERPLGATGAEEEERALRIANEILDSRFYRVDKLIRPMHSTMSYDVVWRFAGAWRRDPRQDFSNTHIKLYKVPSKDPATWSFLETLWSHERRVLLKIGSRRKGRSLARLRHSESHADEGYLVLVTEPVGPLTLRDFLANGRATRWKDHNRSVLWRELLALFHGLDALHQGHYFHRNLRPEAIYVRLGSDSDDSDFQFKLADFEWSIYLHSMPSDGEARKRHNDFYCAPEVILSGFNHDPDQGERSGEGYEADLYSLGLVLFELIVRPITPLELKEFRSRRSYSLHDHRRFVTALREEVRDAPLTEDVRLLLLGLLRFDAGQRVMTLDKAMAMAKRLALAAESLQLSLDRKPLQVITTLGIETPESISNYIQRYPGVNRRFADREELRLFIMEELRNAYVYENATSDTRPLFLEGRTVNFTVTPFELGGSFTHQLAYLMVATRLDSPQPQPIARLTAGVRVENLLPERDRARHVADGDARWETLFSLTGDVESPLSVEQREREGLLHQALRLTAEAEEAALEEQVIAYELIEGPMRVGTGAYEVIRIGPRATEAADENVGDDEKWRLALRRLVATHTQLESPEFELVNRHRISDWIDPERIWQARDVDSEHEAVVLVRKAREGATMPAIHGWIRPCGIAGGQALLARRRDLLRRLVGDHYVLGALSDPAGTHQELTSGDLDWFLPLDEDKHRIVSRMQTASPMLLVQGPPGTGKTTLAAEVVLQEMHRFPASRILVTAQGHDPLNHLLDTVKKQFEKQRRKQEGTRISDAIFVRVVPERRLSTTRDELKAPGRDLEIQCNPAAVALKLLEDSLRRTPKDMPVDPELITAWKGFVHRQRALTISAEIQERITNSANVVFATANDRTIQQRTPGRRPYDLLIYEEAGRALPLELIGPMTGASRWLLIGDPKQLPPHQVDDLRRILGAKLGETLVRDEALRTTRYLSQRRQYAMRILEPFQRLWNDDQDKTYTDHLTIQYRMHPAISDAVSNVYYDGALRCATPDQLRGLRKHRVTSPKSLVGRAIVWIDVPCVAEAPPWFGEEPAAGGGYTNHAEIQVIHDLLHGAPPLAGSIRHGDLVFLSPYRAQVRRFQQVFSGHRVSGIPNLGEAAHTVDAFQGRQAGIVIVSLVRNNDMPRPSSAMGFLTNPSRSVVMFSRAESLLVVVGSSSLFCEFDPRDSPVRRFYEYVSQLEAEGETKIIPSSVFLRPESVTRLKQNWRRNRGLEVEDGDD